MMDNQHHRSSTQQPLQQTTNVELDPSTSTVVDQFANYPLKNITHAHPHDVLCGRGGQSNSHPGNAQWRMLVAANKELYVTLPKKQKMLLSQSIVNAVRSQNPPGRFLQKDSDSNSLWYDVGDKRAQEKTSQALREGAPDIRTKLHTNVGVSLNPGAAIPNHNHNSNNITTPTSNLYGSETPRTKTAIPQEIFSSSTSYIQQPYGTIPQPPSLKEQESSISTQSTETQPTTNCYIPPIASSSVLPQHQPGYYASANHSNDYYVETTSAASDKRSSGINGLGMSSNTPTIEQQYSKSPNRLDNRQEPRMINPKADYLFDRYPPYYSNVNNYTGDGTPSNTGSGTNAKTGQANSFQAKEVSASTFNNDATFGEVPPTTMDLKGDFSFGSIGMLGELEQAQLMNGISFGTVMSYGYTGNNNKAGSGNEFDPPYRCIGGPQNKPNDEAAESTSTIVQTQQTAFPNVNDDTDDVPLPVDGGLEPIGLSFGSMMSVGTTVMENARLEGAGLSFGSMMSYTVGVRGNSAIGAGQSGGRCDIGMPKAVDGGLQDIGTSFGSLSLGGGTVTDREQGIESVKQQIVDSNAGSNPQQSSSYGGSCDYDDGAAMAPPIFKQTKSQGNLLECSDTESEEEEQSSAQLSAQKSAEWSRMQAALAAHTTPIRGSDRSDQGSNSHNNYVNAVSRSPTITNGYNSSSSSKNAKDNENSNSPGLSHRKQQQAQLTDNNYHSADRGASSGGVPGGTMLNIPVPSFDRDFSQMSAISVNEDDFTEDFEPLDYSNNHHHHNATTKSTATTSYDYPYHLQQQQQLQQEEEQLFNHGDNYRPILPQQPLQQQVQQPHQFTNRPTLYDPLPYHQTMMMPPPPTRRTDHHATNDQHRHHQQQGWDGTYTQQQKHPRQFNVHPK